MSRRAIYVCLFMITVLSCKEDVDTCQLDGVWYFDTVMRNDRVTNTLQDGYFEFKEGGKFASNIFEEGRDYDYTVAKKTISIMSDQKLELEIEYCTMDTLILTGEMSLFKMDFLLTKTRKVDSLDLRSINPVDAEELPDDQLY